MDNIKKTKPLILNLKRKYFEQIKSGEKKFEYRLKTDYWKKRLIGKDFSQLIIKLGYPKDIETDKIIAFPYHGYEEQEITHEFFGEKPVLVFAIKLEQKK